MNVITSSQTTEQSSAFISEPMMQLLHLWDCLKGTTVTELLAIGLFFDISSDYSIIQRSIQKNAKSSYLSLEADVWNSIEGPAENGKQFAWMKKQGGRVLKEESSLFSTHTMLQILTSTQWASPLGRTGE